MTESLASHQPRLDAAGFEWVICELCIRITLNTRMVRSFGLPKWFLLMSKCMIGATL